MEFRSVEPGGYYLTPQRKELLEETGMDFNFVEEDELSFRTNFFIKSKARITTLIRFRGLPVIMENEVEIREVMTDGVIAVEKDETIVEASNLLEEEGIRGLVVVENGEAIGVIVCRDIVYQVVSEGLDPRDTKVEDIMSTDLIVAEADELLDDVAMAMSKNDISRVPIVEGEMLTGIVTQSDILRAWPGFAEIIGEEIEMNAEATPRPESQSGTCEECENYSEDLREVNGLMLCPECR